MSKFSEYLRQMIKKSGESVSAVSRSIGAERTSIHKALADERILSYKVVQNLARHFNLTIDERNEFFRLYYILLQGEDNFRNREAVCDLLNYLSTLQFHSTPVLKMTNVNLEDTLLRGEYAIRSAIHTLLLDECCRQDNCEFNFFLPVKLDITMELMDLWLSGRTFTVNQLLCFHSGENTVIENLQFLRAVIPLSLASRGQYRPYYFHEKSGSVTLTPMSYYIITPNYLIQFAGDLSTAQIQKKTELVEYFTSHFHNLLQCCDPLTRCDTDLVSILHKYIDTTSPDELQILMAQPCPGRYITQDVIAKYLKNQNFPYEPLFDLVEQHFSRLRQIPKYYTVFTEKGLMDLLENRSLADLPPEYVPPLEKEDINNMLRQLMDDIRSGNLTGLITRPMQLQLPDYLSIYVNSKTGIHIYSTNSFIFGAYCCNIHITEESLCNTFYDFIQSLPGSPMVYSTEDCLRLLEQRIKENEKKEPLH